MQDVLMLCVGWNDPALQEPAWPPSGDSSLFLPVHCGLRTCVEGLGTQRGWSTACGRVRSVWGCRTCWGADGLVCRAKGVQCDRASFCMLCIQNSPWNKLSLDELQHWKETGSSSLKIGSKHRLIYIKCTWSDWIRAWKELKKVAVTRLLYLLSSRTWCLCLQQQMKEFLLFVSVA